MRAVLYALLPLVAVLTACSPQINDLSELAELKRDVIEHDGWNAGYIPTFGDNTPGFANSLEIAAERIGITVDDPRPECGLGVGAFGTSHFMAGCIAILKELGPDARAQTLAHELAHFMAPAALHTGDSQSEVFAESVSYLVVLRAMKAYVRDGDDKLAARRTYAAYMAKHKKALFIMDYYRNEIIESADLIWELAR